MIERDGEANMDEDIDELRVWLGSDVQAGGDYSVRLSALDAISGTVRGATEINIQIEGNTEQFGEDFADASLPSMLAGRGLVVLNSDGTATFAQAENAGSTEGPATQFDGYRTDRPDVFTATVDIEINNVEISDGEGFDYSVAANGANGSHLRDFIFQIANVDGDVYVGAANGTDFDPHLGLPENGGVILDDGWYTFRHTMYANDAGDLAVRMEILDRESGDVVFTDTLSNPGDDFAIYGGNRYGWFTNIDVNEGVQVDNGTSAAQYFDYQNVA